MHLSRDNARYAEANKCFPRYASGYASRLRIAALQRYAFKKTRHDSPALVSSACTVSRLHPTEKITFLIFVNA